MEGWVNQGECETVSNADGFRIIQLHPSLHCNLACAHCYSSSSPAFRNQGLAPRALEPFLTYARTSGYNTISISGGEPFLYDGLEELVAIARDLDFKILTATNGMLLKSARSQRILRSIDLVAVSIDGLRELHDEIRRLKGSFDKMLQGVDILRSMDKTYGFIHTLTLRSWFSLLHLAELVHDHGAKLLQLHPLEMYGRAVGDMGQDTLDQITLHKIFFLRSYLESKYENEMRIQLDLLHRDYIQKHPLSVEVYPHIKHYEEQPLSSIVKNIVIDHHGNILPVSYGFSEAFTIGNIHRHQNWFEDFQQQKGAAFQRILENTYEVIVHDTDTDLVNWNERIIQASQESLTAITS